MWQTQCLINPFTKQLGSFYIIPVLAVYLIIDPYWRWFFIGFATRLHCPLLKSPFSSMKFPARNLAKNAEDSPLLWTLLGHFTSSSRGIPNNKPQLKLIHFFVYHLISPQRPAIPGRRCQHRPSAHCHTPRTLCRAVGSSDTSAPATSLRSPERRRYGDLTKGYVCVSIYSIYLSVCLSVYLSIYMAC